MDIIDRGEEHLKALRDWSIESTLWKHHQDTHGADEDPNFEMKAVSYTPSPLVRQCMEARMIHDSQKNLMNRRGEWGQNLPPRLTIEDDTGMVPEEGKRVAVHQEGRSAKRKRISMSGCRKPEGERDQEAE